MGGVIIDKALYRDGRREPCGDLSDELATLRERRELGDFLWLGLKDPTEAEFDAVDDELRLHPLAVEDALNGRQRAKIELYEDSIFVVLKTLRYLDDSSDIETGELKVFVGDHFVLTVRSGELSPLTGIRALLESDPDRLRMGPLAVLHAIVDAVVDRYVEIDREVQADLEQIEATVFAGDTREATSIYALKREVLEFKRAALPLHVPLQMLHTSPRSPVRDTELRLLFRDVGDHLHGVIDHIESYDRLLSDILGAHLSQVGVQQNEDMRKISAYVAMAAVPTLIAGIYGMNFEHMPELSWRYGYAGALGLMLMVVAGLWVLFKRNNWL